VDTGLMLLRTVLFLKPVERVSVTDNIPSTSAVSILSRGGTGMGRTVPTFTQVIQQEMESWSKFRRGLRKEDQEAFDEIFRAARMQLASSAYAARPIPFESIIISALIAQQRTIHELQQWLRPRRVESAGKEHRAHNDDAAVITEP
jgi:hypothetical protein